jgi:hypothetical protein
MTLLVLLQPVQLVLLRDDLGDGSDRAIELHDRTLGVEVLPPVPGKVGALPRTLEDGFAEVCVSVQVPDRMNSFARDAELDEPIQDLVEVGGLVFDP